MSLFQFSSTSTAVWHQDAAYAVSIGPPADTVPRRLGHNYPVTFRNLLTGATSSVWVFISYQAALFFNPGPSPQVLPEEPDSVRNALPAMVVLRAAQMAHPSENGGDLLEPDFVNAFKDLTRRSGDLDHAVVALAQLLLKLDDRETSTSAMGAALSLSVSLHEVRHAARVLLRDELIESSAALYSDEKLASFDPFAALQIAPGKRRPLRDFLLTHEKLARLPVRFDFSNVHKAIAKASQHAFEAGEYANAQLAALREVSLSARTKSGVDPDRDRGKKTMTRIWARDRASHAGHAWLRVGDATESGQNLQDATQALFEGAQTLSNVVRHDRPHLGGSAEEAFEVIVLASLLAPVGGAT